MIGNNKTTVYALLVGILLISASKGSPVSTKKRTIHGIVYIDGQPAYIDERDLNDAFRWYKSPEQDLKPSKAQHTPETILWGNDSLDIDDGSANHKTFSYKIINGIGNVSRDDHNWRPINIKVIQIGPTCRHLKGVFLQKVYLESDFFAGTFDVVQVLGKRPRKEKPPCK